jgi:hypothetical protein
VQQEQQYKRGKIHRPIGNGLMRLYKRANLGNTHIRQVMRQRPRPVGSEGLLVDSVGEKHSLQESGANAATQHCDQ